MANATPEELAKDFARRWLSHESQAVREIGERELLKMIRQAAGQAEPPNGQSRAA
ncbi:MAG TPA: hypothetical protein VN656_09660 [Stellaceae bacterium]|nr:hypothetical protein [Stellaceae bacterium]